MAGWGRGLAFLGGRGRFRIVPQLCPQKLLGHAHRSGQGTAAQGLQLGDACAHAGLADSTPLIKSGKIKAIAALSPQRLALLPNVPTVAESGYPGFDMGSLTVGAEKGYPARQRNPLGFSASA